ncbi:DUF159 family protein [Leptospira hartskeerlii]|uniref:Abasic site processing protein n=1 Tax=Leptospira hartskeerlii TaxID=2023177 RepID=A0A2M9X8D4_9LEPT|nr:SOS response-associated peptidase [Leptospira hartskeerlii]PJZ23961.1 DUF159 family protein [Leptospira hartskeerlii]PJZ35225.1 DUF159 family protein [Leptospira hartskeerlii]
MCSRVAQSNRWSKAQPFLFAKPGKDTKSRYNITLTDKADIILKPGIDYTVEDATFWLINEGSKSFKYAMQYSTFNAKSETIFELKSFKSKIYNQRCIIPVDAFYESKGPSGNKQPYVFRLKDKQPFGFAGVFSKWLNPDIGSEIVTFAIITTEANELVAKYHEKKRMPVILPPESYESWLDEKLSHKEDISLFFQTYPASEMEVFPVSKQVISTKNRIFDEECLKEVYLEENSPELF